jgi:hypothetical protein
MKIPNRQLIGILLVLGAIVCSAVYQGFGPGLITSDNPAIPAELVAQGITLTGRTVYRFALFPLVAVGIVGFVFAMLPKRDEPALARSQRS